MNVLPKQAQVDFRGASLREMEESYADAFRRGGDDPAKVIEEYEGRLGSLDFLLAQMRFFNITLQ
ncbi:hypothetical protein CMI48_02570 [Candidatus Pacearchaeota archaeon]|jgi:hypothetical protein|nr:hypothetical protein [Candidatus Pacearchaeota archaeon]|tara:strand:+ start:1023 stop:1217 length:195 start_codon:yes stop_codon:yes gene_type:complete